MIAGRPPRAPGNPDRQLAEHRRALDEVMRDPLLNARTIVVNLPNATAVRVRHGLGRPFTNYFLSAPQGATATGRIVESSGDDMTEVVLTANGFGATITVRITVF